MQLVVENSQEAKILIEHISKLYSISSSLQGWALSMVGATILLIVSSSYYRANQIRFRLIYLLFIPSWVFAFISMYASFKISGILSAAFLQSKGSEKQIERLEKMAGIANGHYANQILYFEISLVILFIWLICFLLWWIFVKKDVSKVS